MTITVAGNKKDVAEGLTVAQLVSTRTLKHHSTLQ